MKTENYIQQEIVMWYNNTYCLTTHPNRGMILSIPNGGGRDGREGKTLKNTGLLPGASDLIIVLPSGLVAWIEVKTDIGIQSPLQQVFQSRVERLGHKYYLVRSLDEFKSIPQLTQTPLY